MDKIKPFCATYYNPAKFQNIDKLVCPPYDVIDQKLHQTLKNQSPFNYIHVLLAENNNYVAIGKKFKAWGKDKVLVDNQELAYYLYQQCFSWEKKNYLRFGILVLLKMDNKVLAHEHTLAKPKADRKKMIAQVKANLSPIFVVVPKPVKLLAGLMKKYTRFKPFITCKDCYGITNRLWKIDQPEEIKKITAAFSKEKLVIADGHHRFEISYDYFRKNKGRFKDLDYLMAFVTDAQKGLLILPTHRVATMDIDLTTLLKRLADKFYLKTVTRDDCQKILKRTSKKFEFCLYAQGKFYYLALKDQGQLKKVAGNHLYKSLDTYLLHHCVFKFIAAPNKIEYTHSIKEAQTLAANDKVAFLLKAAPITTVFDMASKGVRFPQKSTYFYPKLLSGIILRRFSKS